MSYTVEVCCYTIEDVRRASRAGATRVELCADIFAGGTTPSYGLIEHVLETVPIDVAVMIRPRGGDFLYSDDEFGVMQRDIAVAGSLGVEGVVFGVLDEHGFLDLPRMEALIATAKHYDLRVCFHRAFDKVQDPYETLKQLIDLGVDRLLTSGQKPTAVLGLPLLQELLGIAGDSLTIIPGGRVRGHNIQAILDAGITNVHTGSMETRKSKMKTKRTDLSMGSPKYNEDTHMVINEKDVASIVQAVKQKATQTRK